MKIVAIVMLQNIHNFNLEQHFSIRNIDLVLFRFSLAHGSSWTIRRVNSLRVEWVEKDMILIRGDRSTLFYYFRLISGRAKRKKIFNLTALVCCCLSISMFLNILYSYTNIYILYFIFFFYMCQFSLVRKWNKEYFIGKYRFNTWKEN